MLLCNVCGAEGEKSFSKTEEGELVCDLCGTRSFLQIRNETQEVEDSGGIGKSKSIYQRRGNTKRKPKLEIRPYTLEDCLVACQHILYCQTNVLVEKGLCPTSIIGRTKHLWFHFLQMWEQKAERPLVECFSDYCTRQNDDERDNDHDHEPTGRKSTLRDRTSKRKDAQGRFNRFTIAHCFSLIYLACRAEGLGIFPADVARWGMNGTLPTFEAFHVLLSLDLQQVLAPVRNFYIWWNAHPRASTIDAYAAYLELNLALRLPPLNVPLLAWRLVTDFELPPNVFHAFCLLTGVVLSSVNEPLVKRHRHHEISSFIEILAYLIVAIKISPGWHTWHCTQKSKHTQEFFVPWTKEDLAEMPRKHVQPYADFCHKALGSSKYIPPSLLDHVESLRNVSPDPQHPTNDQESFTAILRNFPTHWSSGVGMNPIGTSELEQQEHFYPLYRSYQHTLRHHAAFEKIVQLLCEWTDYRISTVMLEVDKLEQALKLVARKRALPKRKRDEEEREEKDS